MPAQPQKYCRQFLTFLKDTDRRFFNYYGNVRLDVHHRRYVSTSTLSDYSAADPPRQVCDVINVLQYCNAMIVAFG